MRYFSFIDRWYCYIDENSPLFETLPFFLQCFSNLRVYPIYRFWWCSQLCHEYRICLMVLVVVSQEAWSMMCKWWYKGEIVGQRLPEPGFRGAFLIELIRSAFEQHVILSILQFLARVDFTWKYYYFYRIIPTVGLHWKLFCECES